MKITKFFIGFTCTLTLLISTSINLNAQVHNDIKSAFNKYVTLNNKFISTKDKIYANSLELYAEEKLPPVLDTFQKITCLEFDTCLFTEFVKMLLATENVADEDPANSLGFIFICQTQRTSEYIQNMDKKKRDIIINLLEFGFLNVTSVNNSQDYSKQKLALKTLKEL